MLKDISMAEVADLWEKPGKRARTVLIPSLKPGRILRLRVKDGIYGYLLGAVDPKKFLFDMVVDGDYRGRFTIKSLRVGARPSFLNTLMPEELKLTTPIESITIVSR